MNGRIRRMDMETTTEKINSILVEVFNRMLDVEETSLAQSEFSDLSVKEMHTIEAIGLHDHHTTTHVANKLNVTVGTLTVAVNALVRKGYVERLKLDSDKRIVRLALTRKGKLLYRLHRRFHVKLVQKTIQGMTREEIEVLTKGLYNLHEFLHEIVLDEMGNK